MSQSDTSTIPPAGEGPEEPAAQAPPALPSAWDKPNENPPVTSPEVPAAVPESDDPDVTAKIATADPVGAPSPRSPRRRTSPKRRTTRLLLLGGGSALLLAYIVAGLVAGSGVQRGSTVLGIPIGTLSVSEAAAKLEAQLPARLPDHIEVTSGEEVATVDPAAAGMSVDYDATVEAAGRASLNPIALFRQLAGRNPVEPVVTVDETAMASTLGALAERFDQAPRDGAITFSDGVAQPVDATAGRALDKDVAQAALTGTYASGSRSVDAPVETAEPQIGQAEVERAMTELAAPALSGPVTLTVSGESIDVPVATFASYLSTRVEGGRLALAVDGQGLRAALADELEAVEVAGKNATFRIANGSPVVVPSQDGEAVAPDDLAAAILAVLPSQGDRVAEAELTVAQPALTTEQAAALGVAERVATWTTNVPYAAYRATNIAQAVAYLNGAVVPPGDEFSMNDRVGPRTAERGFVRGIVISGGALDADWGGGISALATSLFNAVFYAGVEDVEHHPHSYWITRYPKGTESTVSWGSKDVRFINDSDNGIFITASSTNTSVTVTFWGTKKWDISRIEGQEYNVKPFDEIERDRCVPQPGMRGFDVDVWRVFEQDGEEVKRERFRTHYIPANHITCEEVIRP